MAYSQSETSFSFRVCIRNPFCFVVMLKVFFTRFCCSRVYSVLAWYHNDPKSKIPFEKWLRKSRFFWVFGIFGVEFMNSMEFLNEILERDFWTEFMNRIYERNFWTEFSILNHCAWAKFIIPRSQWSRSSRKKKTYGLRTTTQRFFQT